MGSRRRAANALSHLTTLSSKNPILCTMSVQIRVGPHEREPGNVCVHGSSCSIRRHLILSHSRQNMSPALPSTATLAFPTDRCMLRRIGVSRSWQKRTAASSNMAHPMSAMKHPLIPKSSLSYILVSLTRTIIATLKKCHEKSILHGYMWWQLWFTQEQGSLVCSAGLKIYALSMLEKPYPSKIHSRSQG